jgi:hypothetical protein
VLAVIRPPPGFRCVDLHIGHTPALHTTVLVLVAGAEPGDDGAGRRPAAGERPRARRPTAHHDDAQPGDITHRARES